MDIERKSGKINPHNNRNETKTGRAFYSCQIIFLYFRQISLSGNKWKVSVHGISQSAAWWDLRIYYPSANIYIFSSMYHYCRPSKKIGVPYRPILSQQLLGGVHFWPKKPNMLTYYIVSTWRADVHRFVVARVTRLSKKSNARPPLTSTLAKYMITAQILINFFPFFC